MNAKPVRGLINILSKLSEQAQSQRDAEDPLGPRFNWWDGMYRGLDTAKEVVRQCRRKAKPKPKPKK